jgi:hypothetical protein
MLRKHCSASACGTAHAHRLCAGVVLPDAHLHAGAAIQPLSFLYYLHLSLRHPCGSLAAQALYFMWSIEKEGVKPGMAVQGPPQFWWWQYLWLSLVAMSTYALEAAMQFWPWSVTFLCTRDNSYLNAFLGLFFPIR